MKIRLQKWLQQNSMIRTWNTRQITKLCDILLLQWRNYCFPARSNDCVYKMCLLTWEIEYLPLQQFLSYSAPPQQRIRNIRYTAEETVAENGSPFSPQQDVSLIGHDTVLTRTIFRIGKLISNWINPEMKFVFNWFSGFDDSSLCSINDQHDKLMNNSRRKQVIFHSIRRPLVKASIGRHWKFYQLSSFAQYITSFPHTCMYSFYFVWAVCLVAASSNHMPAQLICHTAILRTFIRRSIHFYY